MRIITAQKPGSLVRLIRESCPGLSYSALMKALRQRDVRVNGSRIGRDTQIMPGDEIRLYVADRLFDEKVDIVYIDDNIAVVDKRQGILTVGEGGLEGALAIQMGAPVFPVHRLDFATSGLVAFALNAATQCELEAAFRERRVQKSYFAVVKGEIEPEGARLTHFFVKRDRKARVTVLDAPAPGAVTAVSDVSVIRRGDGRSLVNVRLLTGRTHQIRAQMSHIGHPVLGDDKYGDRAWNRGSGARRLYLHSCGLSFQIPSGDLEYISGMEFKSSAPFDI